jgi:uncharacterized protein involved in outer membrane biogenesis
MRWKWFVAAAVMIVVIFMVAAYVYLKTYDYNKLKPLVAQMVEDATGRKLSLAGDFNIKFGFQPRLAMTDVALANASWGSQPQMLEIQKLQARVRLLPLLVRTLDVRLIHLDGIRVLLEKGPNAEHNWSFPPEDDPDDSPGIFTPNTIKLGRARIENLNFISLESDIGPPTRAAIANLEMKRLANEDALTLTLQADYNGQPVTLSGKTGLLAAIFEHRPFPLQLTGELAKASVKIDGAIEDVLYLQGINVDTRLSGHNFATLGPVLEVQLPETETFDIAGNFKGTADALGLNIDGSLTGSSINIAVNGSIGNLNEFSGVDLNLKSSGKDLAVMRPIMGEGIPSTKEFAVEGHLAGSSKAMSLSNARADVRHKSMHFTASGGIEDLVAFSGMDLKSRLAGGNFAELGPIIDVELPATDAFDIQGQLTGDADVMPLHDVQATGRRGSMHIAITGTIQDLSSLEGMDLQSHLTGKNLVEFGEVIDVALPSTDAFEIQGRLIGSTDAATLQKAAGIARRGGLHLTLAGKVRDLYILKGMDLQSSLAGKDLAEFGEVIGENLPSTDEFKIKGRLTGSPDVLTLQKATGSGRRGSLRMSVTGAVKHLPALKGLDAQTRLSGKNLVEFGEIIGIDLPATDAFKVQGHLIGSPDALTLQKAQGSARRGSMHLALSGAVQDLPTLEGMDLQSRLSGKELAEIGPLFDTELPGLGLFDIDFRLSGSAEAIALDEFSAIVDKSDFSGQAKVEFRKRPRITARLDSSIVDFTTLMNSLEQDPQKDAKKKRPEGRFFSDDPLPLDALEMVDTDILLTAENILARNARFKSGHLKLKIQDSDLIVGDFETMYEQTKISVGFNISHGSPNRFATELLVQNFDLGRFLKEIEISDKVEATVDIASHLDSRGDSVRSLMANLNGSIGAVMGEGYLTEYLDMLSAGLTNKVLKFWRIPGESGSQINCAVVQFDMEFGVATSRAFVFNTRAGVLNVRGDIDLDTEKINLLLVPTPSQPDLSYMTNLRVSGTLLDPDVEPDKASVALRGSTALSALVIGPLGLLAPFVRLGAKNEHACDVESIGEVGLSKPAAK